VPLVTSAASVTSGSAVWDDVVQDTHVLERMFAAAMDGLMDGCMNVYMYVWICSPFIVLDRPPRSHLHPQFLFYPVSIHSNGLYVYPLLWEVSTRPFLYAPKTLPTMKMFST
jgi:hypothetical protein